MKKKLLALTLVLAMVLTLVPTTFSAAAAYPAVTAAYNKSAKTVTVIVGDFSQSFADITNNTTKTFVLANGWEVNVTAKNDVATVNSYKIPVIQVPEVEAEKKAEEADPIVVEEESNSVTDLRIVRVEQSWSKTTFHCNYTSGNGRVWPQVGPYTKSNDGKVFLVLEEIPGTTAWRLIDVEDIYGNSLGVPVCPGKNSYCGSTDWISFSNNSGEPDGKNIQLQHGHYAEIVKEWTDDNPNGIEAIFDIYKYSATAVDNRGQLVVSGALPGEKYILDAGTYVVAERVKEGYIIQPDQIITVSDNQALISVSFTNEPIGKTETEIAIHKFVGEHGNTNGNTLEEFVFDIINADNQVVGTMYSNEEGVASYTWPDGLPEGVYIIRERVPAGYKSVNDLRFYVDENGAHTWLDKDVDNEEINYIINIPDDPYKEISLNKYVVAGEGYIDIEGWAEGAGYTTNDLIECFNLYTTTGPNGDKGDLVDSKQLAGGKITFQILDDGWYVIEEVLTTLGKTVFEEPGLVYVGFFNGNQVGGSDFDYDAFYTVVNGYGSGYVLGYPGLNNSGDIFPIGVTNVNTNETYASFCANAGSRNFAGESGLGCRGYLVANTFRDDAFYADFVSAFNYIRDNYGTLDATLRDRALTQTVMWVLLGAIDITTDEFWAIKDEHLDKSAVVDVINNYLGYTGNGLIVDVVYMTCEYNHSYYDCQPQLVPVYGGSGFYNIPVGKTETEIAIRKFVGERGNTNGDTLEEFAFDIINADNQVVGTMYSDETGAAGYAWPDGLPEGVYIIRERVPTGYMPVNDLGFYVDEKGAHTWLDKDADNEEINYIINKLIPFTSVSFNKEALDLDETETRAAIENEFAFELYMYNDESGEFEIAGTYLTGLNGGIVVENLYAGRYYFKEVNAYAYVGLSDLYFEVVVVDGDAVVVWDDFDEDIPTVVNVALGALEVTVNVTATKEITYYKKEWLTKDIKETLVSGGVVVAGSMGNSGQTFVAIDVAQASTEAGVDVEIAYSTKPTPTGIGLYYNVKIVDNQIIVSVKDGNIVSYNVGIQSFATYEAAAARGPGKPGGKDNNMAVGTLAFGQSLSVPLLGDGIVAYLYVHADAITFYTGEFIWIFDYAETVAVDYEGVLTLDISGHNGFNGTVNNGETVTFWNLEAGEYTITLSGDGFEDQVQTVTVDNGKTTTVAFAVSVSYTEDVYANDSTDPTSFADYAPLAFAVDYNFYNEAPGEYDTDGSEEDADEVETVDPVEYDPETVEDPDAE